MQLFKTLGGPSDAPLQEMARAARQAWADLFTISAEYDTGTDCVVIVCRHGKNSYKQTIAREVFGQARLRMAAVASAADTLHGEVQVTQWAISEAIRNLSAQMGPVQHISDRMERAEEALEKERSESTYRLGRWQYFEGKVSEMRDWRARSQDFWALPWYKRVWRALLGSSGIE